MYTFNSGDFWTSYRDYIFIIKTADGTYFIPEKIKTRLIQQEDMVANGSGGFNFHTMPKNKPVDTKSVMVTSMPTNSILIKDKEPKINIYPNPAYDKIFIELANNEPSFYEVINIMGKIVLKNELHGNIIPIDNLITGIYILRLNNNGVIYKSKFIKE